MASVAVQAQSIYVIFGSYGSADGQFKGVTGVDVNDTHIFVADRHNDRIQIFDLDGVFQTKFGSYGFGNGQFNGVVDVSLNETHVFVVDTGNVQIFDLAGNFQMKLTTGIFNYTNYMEVAFPHGIAINQTHIFVTGNDRIQIFDLAGNFRFNIGNGTPGTADGQLQFPTGIEVNGSHIFVADKFNHRIQIFDLAGNFQAKIGITGSSESAEGQFFLPEDVALNATHIFVADTTNNRIQIFDLAGNFQAQIGKDEIRLSQPNGITVRNNKIYVALRSEIHVIQNLMPTSGTNLDTTTGESLTNTSIRSNIDPSSIIKTSENDFNSETVEIFTASFIAINLIVISLITVKKGRK